MPWWKSSSSRVDKLSPSAEASPRNGRREFAFLWNKRCGSSHNLQARHQRQRAFRPFVDVGPGGIPDGNAVMSIPVSRSPCSGDYAASRSSSTPVLLPHPLPLPEDSHNNGFCAAGACASGCAGCRLPSPMEATVVGTMEIDYGSVGCRLPSPMAATAVGTAEMEEGSGGSLHLSTGVGTEASGERILAASESKLASNARNSTDHVDLPSKRYNFSCQRKAIHDPNSVESITFRLNIPARSAPPSGFSSPVFSPRRLSSVDAFGSDGFKRTHVTNRKGRYHQWFYYLIL
ncbi:hypothetical protein HPP92_019081 [Vanilla planifolia]|uniref:Uncharacterized protein n=1 Tax=Vanilla planifolia TaxID=51239 RepID=A0A835UKE5_VANPL|nr:hypothetical protein HPP92_019081 [Vanilla planifolia]